MNNKARNSEVDNARILSLNPKIQHYKINDCIGISTIDGIEIIKISNILYCKAESSYCTIYSRDGSKVTASKTLKIVEAALNENTFIRVHQSYVVCLTEIQRVSRDGIILENGKSIPVSRTKRPELMQMLHEVTNIL